MRHKIGKPATEVRLVSGYSTEGFVLKHIDVMDSEVATLSFNCLGFRTDR